LFQPVQQAITIPILAKLAAVNSTFFFHHVTLEAPQEVVCGVVEKFALGLCSALGCRFHNFNFP